MRHSNQHNQYIHKPKLEDDYRNKNIHKVKRLHGSNVMSPKSEKALQYQGKHFKKDNQFPPVMGMMPLGTAPPIESIIMPTMPERSRERSEASSAHSGYDSRQKYGERKHHTKRDHYHQSNRRDRERENKRQDYHRQDKYRRKDHSSEDAESPKKRQRQESEAKQEQEDFKVKQGLISAAN